MKDKFFNLDLKKVINKFLENKNSTDIQEISVKTGKNIQNLIEKIRMSLDNTKYNHSFNSISELNTKYIKNIPLNNTRTLHFLLLGDKNVGKTVFFNGYLHKNFNDPMLNTIGINEGLKYIKLDNVIYKLTMTDIL